ncbi:MAG: terminase large subunit [Lentisphaeria bacterium]|nr:terminase large subunit [Lentisphaeria bacterium]
MRRRGSFWKRSLAGFDFWADTGESQFFPALAEWAVDFFPRELTFTTGRWAGQPFELQEWQQQLVGHLFGWLRPDGTRRFRRALVYVPRKNGKTELAAGIALILFCADDEPTAEVYCGASTVNQGNILYRKAKKMVRNNPRLNARIKPPKGRTNRTLFDEETDSILQVLPADEESAQGFNAHAGVVDELHTQRDGGFSGALAESMGARRQPLLLEITTAADPGENYCNSELDYAVQVLQRKISDPSFLPVIFRAEESDDPGDPVTWRKANPSIGVTEPESFYRDNFRKMSRTASGLARFKKYFLNCQTPLNAAWIEPAFWDACRADFPLESLEGQSCCMAVDRSSVSDISAVGMLFPERCAFHCEFIVPRATAEENIIYEQWAKQGLIRISESAAITDEELFDLIAEQHGRFRVESMSYDPWRMAALAQWLSRLPDPDAEAAGRFTDSGLGLKCIPVGQNFREMSEPTNKLEILIRTGKFRHFGNPVLGWMFRNVRVAKDHKENIKLVKETPNSPKKIDGIITAVMASKTAFAVTEEAPKPFSIGGIEWI